MADSNIVIAVLTADHQIVPVPPVAYRMQGKDYLDIMTYDHRVIPDIDIAHYVMKGETITLDTMAEAWGEEIRCVPR